jgi:oxaloacetate decarboxylase alpha subunit
VTNRERYAVIPDEVIRYAIGRFGKPNVPIAPEVMDRIESLPRTRELRAESAMASLAELRQRLGARLSDEEFLLRATMPAGQVDAMLASGPAKHSYDAAKSPTGDDPTLKPVMNLLRQLTARRDLTQIIVEKSGCRVELRRHVRTSDSAGAAP